MTILKISRQGMPLAWITPAMAATMIVKDQVAWSLGDNIATLYDGRGRDGLQSVLSVPAIIASKGQHRDARFTPALNNALLFRRDNNQCLYCGEFFSRKVLTRDHVIPRAQGGPDIWSNVVAACKACNNHKGNRTPEQAGMPLLTIPFVPNPFEFLYLASHRIQGDQWDYLSARWSNKRAWVA